MNEKFTMEGKEYTQRSVNTLKMDGLEFEGNVVPQEVNKAGGIMNVSIHLASDSQQIESIKNTSENIDSNVKISTSEVIENKEPKSWISKILQSIKNIFSKNK